MSVIERLFPQQANNNYQGSPIAQYVFYVLMAIYSFRSIVHFTTEDGGINKIASIVYFLWWRLLRAPLIQTMLSTYLPHSGVRRRY